ncbi:MAG: gfo/Idh/MocA family oxidoreductase, partial [Deltaproteobacteria bacterium]
EIDYEKPEIDEYDALEREIRSFVDAVIHDREPIVSAADGRKALEVALAISDQIKDQWTKRNT